METFSCASFCPTVRWNRIFPAAPACVCSTRGGLRGTRHASVSSNMTSSGLHLSRQQFLSLIHSCNGINQTAANPRSPILGFGSCGGVPPPLAPSEGNMTSRFVRPLCALFFHGFTGRTTAGTGGYVCERGFG